MTVRLLLLAVLTVACAADVHAQPRGATPPRAPTPVEMHVEGRWRLPKPHEYEVHAPTGEYRPVQLRYVVAHLESEDAIYDRTARAWVYHPGTGANPRYLAGSSVFPPGVTAAEPARPPAPGVAPAGEEFVVVGRFRLPKSHRYEWYDPGGRYVPLEPAWVPTLLDRREPVFDRTEREWVYHPSAGYSDRYLIPLAAVTSAEDELIVGRFRLPRAHRYERYTQDGQYVAVELSSVPERLERREPIFDRTARMWVHHPGTGYSERYLVRAPERR